jgi:transposase
MPLGYEVFDGNRSDVTAVEEIVSAIEEKYGSADRIWIMDRGMVSEENIGYLKAGNRRYILGTPKSQLKAFEKHLLTDGWESVREGLEVKLCPSPDGEETFILCRSKDRQEKEKAIHERFEKRVEEGLQRIAESCRLIGKQNPLDVAKRLGKLLGRNTRVEKLFDVNVSIRKDGGAEIVWTKVDAWREWSSLSEECYMLRSNIMGWSAEDLWKAYIQLTQAEAAFRIQKQDLAIRPVWHQKKERVQAHILVCFLAYALWKTLGRLCQRAGLGDEPLLIL